MSLGGVATETLEIVRRGTYRAPSGTEVTIRDAVDASRRGTVLYRPDGFDRVAPPVGASSAAAIEVWAEITAGAARRLAADGDVAALNFASARNPGGGFLGGARAQEEDLARCSALYECQLTQPDYYATHRADRSMLYTDHLIYSPAVPFFRDEQHRLLAEPFLVSIVTAAAPNAGEHLRRDPAGQPAITETLTRRAERVLRVFAHRRQRVLVLGAWGCGVFRNEPAEVASIFHRWLRAPEYRGAFDRIIFAIPGRGRDESTLAAFEREFA